MCLSGPGGCGKTRLALEAARGWAGEIRVAALAGVAAADVSAVIAAALGIGYEAADLATAARVALAGRSMLLPLGIELAATRVRTLDPATLAGTLAEHLRLLEQTAGRAGTGR